MTHYEPELKQEIIRLYLEEGQTMKSLTEGYNLGKGILRYWLKNIRKERAETKDFTTMLNENCLAFLYYKSFSCFFILFSAL